MSQLCAGFARVNITPPMGMPIAGYYQVRLAEKVLDELEANAVAVAAGEEKLLRSAPASRKTTFSSPAPTPTRAPS